MDLCFAFLEDPDQNTILLSGDFGSLESSGQHLE